MAMPDPYQICGTCGKQQKIFCTGLSGSFRFENHYVHGTTKLCAGNGSLFDPGPKLDGRKKPDGPSHTSKVKCRRCWQGVSLTRDTSSGKLVLGKHKSASGQYECSGSLTEPKEKGASS